MPQNRGCYRPCTIVATVRMLSLVGIVSSGQAPKRRVDMINSGCTAHWETGDLSKMPDTASMTPAVVTLDGAQIGYPVDGTTQTTSCDQIAAIGVADGVVRGVSTFVTAGFALGIIGEAGEQIEFKYWNGAQQKEYNAQGLFDTSTVSQTYTMKAGGNLGSFAKGGAQELVLSVAPFCKPCESGCSHYFFQKAVMIDVPEAEGCVDNAGTCEITASGGTWSCHTGANTSTPDCYTPCATPSPSPPMVENSGNQPKKQDAQGGGDTVMWALIGSAVGVGAVLAACYVARKRLLKKDSLTRTTRVDPTFITLNAL